MTRPPRPYSHRPIGGLLAKLRDAIAKLPGQGTDVLARAVNAPRIETGIALRKLVKTGMATRQGERNAATFYPGRAPIDNRRTPEQLRQAQRARELRYREKRRETYARKAAELQPLRDMLKARKREERDEARALRELARRHTKAIQQPAVVRDRARVQRAAILADVTTKADTVAPKLAAFETVEQWLARGNRCEVLPGFVHQPDYRRQARQNHRRQGES